MRSGRRYRVATSWSARGTLVLAHVLMKTLAAAGERVVNGRDRAEPIHESGVHDRRVHGCRPRGARRLAMRFGDRQTLTPPPDAVLESFVRQMSGRRYDMAIEVPVALAGRHRRRGHAEGMVRATPRTLGEVNGVDAEIDRMNQERASRGRSIEAERGSLVLNAPLVWESGGLARSPRCPKTFGSRFIRQRADQRRGELRHIVRLPRGDELPSCTTGRST